MRKTLLLAVIPLITAAACAQGTIVTCIDTVIYPEAKNIGSSYPGINLDAGNSAVALAQRYEAPQPLTVHGFEFFAYESEATVTENVTLTCNLYKVGPTLLPLEPPVATTTVIVDETFGNLDVMRQSAVFPTPVQVNYPYYLSVESSSTTSVAVYTNNYNNHSGRLENLSAGKFGSFWYRGLNITVGGDSFDADALLHPYVSYDIEADFAQDKHCIEDNETLNFTNHSSEIYDSRFYNQHAFGWPLNDGVESFDWNFGDGTLAQNTYDTSHTYGAKSKYVISLVTEVDGWSNKCIAIKRDSVDEVPVADFGTIGHNPVQFVNQSAGSDQTWWDFGDGTTTTNDNPAYAWPTPGNYTVTLIIKNACDSDTISKLVNVSPVGVRQLGQASVSILPNPVHNTLVVTVNSSERQTLELFSADGRRILAKDFVAELAVDVSALPAALYFAKVNSGTAAHQAVVIKR